ncbi:MAG: hypothetical protein Q9187_002544 [Circinaria calcarea]
MYGFIIYKISVLADLNASIEKRLYLKDIDLHALSGKKVGTEFVVAVQTHESIKNTLDNSSSKPPKAPSNAALGTFSSARQDDTERKNGSLIIFKSRIPVSHQRNWGHTPSNAAFGKRLSNGQDKIRKRGRPNKVTPKEDV